MLSKDGTISSSSDVRKAIRYKISQLLLDTKPISFISRFIERSSPCKDLERKANEILGCIPAENDSFKDIIVPLQGQTWAILCNLCKTLNKTSQYTSLLEGE